MISQQNKKRTTPRIDNSKNYFFYLWELAKSNGIFKLTKRIGGYFSRFRIISLTLKILGFVFTAIETSAFIFVIGITVMIFLPPFILGFISILLVSAICFGRDKKRLLGYLGDKNAILFFPARGQKFYGDCFFKRNAFDLSSRGYCVIVVTPFVLSPTGVFDSQKYFLNLKKDGKEIFVIRQQFFFYAQKHLFKNHKKRIIYVY